MSVLSISVEGAYVFLSSTLLLTTFISLILLAKEGKMEDFQSETDSDYTSYWRDWVSFQQPTFN
jgi:hypothetical protein